ncbi:MAG: hypothetical protein ACK4WH_10720 [Phycisphaerales bacterium]
MPGRRFGKGSDVLALVPASAGSLRAEVITDGNDEWLDTIRDVGGFAMPAGARPGDPVYPIYDAVNSINRKNEPYPG